MSAPKKRLIVLSHERSLNKTQSLLNYFNSSYEITLVVNKEISSKKEYTKVCKKIIICPGFDPKEITLQTPECDRVISVSENLLETQSQLEESYRINNLKKDSARILSDKYLLTNFLKDQASPVEHPATILPTDIEGIARFDHPLILKPSIGTGSNHFLEGLLQGLDYTYWQNGNQFLEHLEQIKAVDEFIKINNVGVEKERFNFKKNFALLQKYIPPEGAVYSPVGYIGPNGPTIPFYLKILRFNSSIRNFDFNKSNANLDSLVKADNPPIHLGDFLVMSLACREVPQNIRNAAESYLNFVTERLEIKDLFFAGPDLHRNNGNIFAIDFNPRVGHFFNLMDSRNQNNLVRLCLDKASDTEVTHCLWGAIPYNKDFIPSLETLITIQEKIPLEAIPEAFPYQLPNHSFLQSKPRSLQVLVEGTNEKDLTQKYFDLIRKFNS